MKHQLLICALLALAACKEEVVQDTSPVLLNADAVGHYCQMNLLEHDGPKAQAHLAGLPAAPLFFSQVRDAIAYMRMPEQSHAILAVWVNDMGAAGATWNAPGADNWITAEEAIYVVGARVVGGMGAPEVVPFSNVAKATDFATKNGGTVMRLADIPDSAVLAPVVLDGEETDSDFEDRLRALSRGNGE
ncbi:copper chaperone NosL [Aliiroseovarius crassostreae]|uniref:Copper resistance protein CopZ n=1 Tax=Aliiroseovarius crassostreae TaxID=154981 RepID=A0A0P7KL79_9RHOB|nr:nitrous oxide reductase accessory protein NosL [Aliiroseovarius crassostreae]KPN64753.1 copper resistance protein CopZ [Aliiroseovarius crassostreae]SFU76294.1 copper chaperone NosL [Aliiroseovarius crassostreae]